MTEPRQERKVVTVVFCDLVGFTQQAETLDPEDVAAILRPYHERVRSELEHYGGTVEKFIGDAVMALFGAPVTHEDDPERAVRAALAIREFALGDEFELRVGITTGEALIRLDAQPESGEGMASGDVVNTAARLQSAAPVNEVLVDETTYRATRHAIDYGDAVPVEAKGKADPIPVWQAMTAHARFGVDVAHEARTALVGRERELAVLRDAFERARHERTPQLVTLVGVPGIGKSRLVYELSRIADADPELVTWRQGRCLAYGDGVTLWALGEIVKAQAGIVEQDTDEDVERKLRDAVADVLSGTTDESWVQGELRSLVGLSVESELGDDRRGAAFAAWRRFLEAMAEQRPLVLVFEDLHWADESLLDFVDELVEWISDVPLLVVCTARPELLERRPGWGGGKLNATTLALAPLAEEQTARMIALLLDRPVLSAESQQALLERAGGNPLYAEQFADLYLERGSVDELPLPETLQGIIAARLDSLAEPEKDLLQDAAVVGKVFWASSVGADPHTAAASLHSLERKGFVRRQKRSSVENESEFAFAHALVRDVAYGQIARADRAAKHRRVAEWIEGLGRPDDHAEMLAHHWRSVLELAQASGTSSEDAVERTRVALRDAGDRALALNAFATADGYYAEALELWPVDDDRPSLLFRRALALYSTGDERRASALTEARDALLAAGDRPTAAEAEAYLSRAAWYAGDRRETDAHMAAAEELVAGTGPSAAKARVLAFSARFRMLAGDSEAIPVAREALALAEELDLAELKIHALTTIGGTKNNREPMSGQPELERAVEISKAVNSPLLANALNNIGVGLSGAGDIPHADSAYREALQVAERLGDRDIVRFTRGNLLYTGFFLGRWDEVDADASAFIDECETSPHYMEGAARTLRAYVRQARGDFDGARADWSRGLEQGREIQDPQRLLPALLQAARGNALIGDEGEARELAMEAIAIIRDHPEVLVPLLGQIASVARQLGIRDELRSLLADASDSFWAGVARAQANGDFVAAAKGYADAGAVALEADSRFWAAHELLEAGRRAEAVEQLEMALAFYRSVGATFYLERAQALLAQDQSASA